MKVIVTNLGTNIELGNKGLSIDVYKPDGKTRLGDLRVGKAKIEWCKGKAHSGPTVTWDEFIAWIESK